MKSNTFIYILIFGIITVILLMSGTFFNKNGLSAVKLTIESAYSNVVVCDNTGKIIPNNGNLIVGEKYTATITSIDGYTIGSVKVNGQSVELANDKYEFVCTDTVKIKVSSVLNNYEYTIRGLANTSFKVHDYDTWYANEMVAYPADSVEEVESLYHGKYYVLNFEPNYTTGYTFDTIKLNGSNIEDLCENENYFISHAVVGGKTYSLQYVIKATQNISIVITEKVLYYGLDVNAFNTNVEVFCITTNTVNSSDKLISGYEYKISATAVNDYMLGSLKVNNENFTNNSTFICESDVVINAVSGYELNISSYNVNVKVVDVGQVSELTPGFVLYNGQVLKIVVTPNSGYIMQELKVNNNDFISGSQLTVNGTVNIVAKAVLEDGGSDSMYSLTRICDNVEVVVTYIGDNTNIPDGVDVIHSGPDVVITAIPHEGYLINSIVVNGDDKFYNGGVLSVSENLVIEAYAVAITDENTFNISATIENATLEVYDTNYTLLAKITTSGNYINVGLLYKGYIFKFVANEGFALTSTTIEGENADVVNQYSSFISSDLIIQVKAS